MQYIMFLLGIALAVFIIRMSKKNHLFQKYNKYVVTALVSALVAISLEVFTFNFACFEGNHGLQFAVGYDTATQNQIFENNNGVTKSPTDIMTVNVSHHNREYTYEAVIKVNAELKNLDLTVDCQQNAVPYEVYYKDDAFHKDYNKIKIENLMLVKGIPSTGHIKTHFAGKTDSVKVIFKVKDIYPISNINVQINHPAGFDFNFARFLIVFLVVLLAYIFYFTRKSTAMKKPVFIGVLGLQAVFILFLSIASNAVFDTNGKYKGEALYQSVDPYQELTLALAKGKVDLNEVNTDSLEAERQGIEALQKLENPYEWNQRNEIYYKWDRAFYNGKYYCYFGIVPVLFVYLPIYLLTGRLVNTKIFVLFLVMLTAALMAKLVMTIAQKWKKQINMWVVLGTIVSFINASMILYCINGSKFYELATISALLCAIAGIDCILNAFTNRGIKKKILTVGAFFMALSVGCRPNYILTSFMIAPIVLNAFAKNGGYKRVDGIKSRFTAYVRGIFHKKNIKAIVSFILPYVVIGIGLMYYNYIRFGSITEFGAKYQLTVYDTSYYHMTDLGKIPIALVRGILMLPTMSSVFPYMNAVQESSNYAGYFYDMTYLGILSSPIMWLLCMIPWSIKRGVKQIAHKGFVIASTVIAFVMCYLTTVMGGTSLRYSVDFAWIFFIPVIYVIFAIYSRARERGLEKYAVAGLGILMILTIVVNALVCISPTWSSMSEDVPEIFYRIEEMVVFWK